jgi:hypothetical protein
MEFQIYAVPNGVITAIRGFCDISAETVYELSNFISEKDIDIDDWKRIADYENRYGKYFTNHSIFWQIFDFIDRTNCQDI